MLTSYFCCCLLFGTGQVVYSGFHRDRKPKQPAKKVLLSVEGIGYRSIITTTLLWVIINMEMMSAWKSTAAVVEPKGRSYV